jgi:hypothetical protein
VPVPLPFPDEPEDPTLPPHLMKVVLGPPTGHTVIGRGLPDLRLAKDPTTLPPHLMEVVTGPSTGHTLMGVGLASDEVDTLPPTSRDELRRQAAEAAASKPPEGLSPNTQMIAALAVRKNRAPWVVLAIFVVVLVVVTALLIWR